MGGSGQYAYNPGTPTAREVAEALLEMTGQIQGVRRTLGGQGAERSHSSMGQELPNTHGHTDQRGGQVHGQRSGYSRSVEDVRLHQESAKQRNPSMLTAALPNFSSASVPVAQRSVELQEPLGSNGCVISSEAGHLIASGRLQWSSERADATVSPDGRPGNVAAHKNDVSRRDGVGSPKGADVQDSRGSFRANMLERLSPKALSERACQDAMKEARHIQSGRVDNRRDESQRFMTSMMSTRPVVSRTHENMSNPMLAAGHGSMPMSQQEYVAGEGVPVMSNPPVPTRHAGARSKMRILDEGQMGTGHASPFGQAAPGFGPSAETTGPIPQLQGPFGAQVPHSANYQAHGVMDQQAVLGDERAGAAMQSWPINRQQPQGSGWEDRNTGKQHEMMQQTTNYDVMRSGGWTNAMQMQPLPTQPQYADGRTHEQALGDSWKVDGCQGHPSEKVDRNRRVVKDDNLEGVSQVRRPEMSSGYRGWTNRIAYMPQTEMLHQVVPQVRTPFQVGDVAAALGGSRWQGIDVQGHSANKPDTGMQGAARIEENTYAMGRSDRDVDHQMVPKVMMTTKAKDNGGKSRNKSSREKRREKTDRLWSGDVKGEKRHKTRRRQNSISESSSSEGETVEDSDSDHSSVHSSFRTRGRSRRSPRLPAFDGKKEVWKIWFNRLEEVGRRQGWDDGEKLDELLPRLEGTAAEFAYSQLSSSTRSSYKKLTTELGNRFRKIESESSYRTQFDNRGQKTGETIEDFAAALKMIYDKAYPTRDKRTRKEDLLRRFLSGLSDDEARYLVDYVKSPKDIDDAVVDVVAFQESRRSSFGSDKSRKRHGRVRFDGMDTSDNSESEARVIRAVGRPPKNGKKNKEDVTSVAKDDVAKETDGDSDAQSEWLLEKLTEKFTSILPALIQKGAAPHELKKERDTNQFKGGNMNRGRGRGGGDTRNPSQKYPQVGGGAPQFSGGPQFGVCYKCGQAGHFARECWSFSGQVQVSTQPGYGPPNIQGQPGYGPQNAHVQNGGGQLPVNGPTQRTYGPPNGTYPNNQGPVPTVADGSGRAVQKA